MISQLFLTKANISVQMTRWSWIGILRKVTLWLCWHTAIVVLAEKGSFLHYINSLDKQCLSQRARFTSVPVLEWLHVNTFSWKQRNEKLLNASQVKGGQITQQPSCHLWIHYFVFQFSEAFEKYYYKKKCCLCNADNMLKVKRVAFPSRCPDDMISSWQFVTCWSRDLTAGIMTP